jgi:prolyl-tRNA synthetase
LADLLESLRSRPYLIPVDSESTLQSSLAPKDSDLIGIPLRVTVGERALKQGQVELKPRSEPDPKRATLLALDQAAAELAKLVRAGRDGGAKASSA